MQSRSCHRFNHRPKLPLCRWFVAILVSLLPVTGVAQEVTTVTNLGQLSLVPLEKAKTSQKCELTGVVTYVDSRQQYFHLQDETGAAQIRLERGWQFPLLSQRVRIKGNTAVQSDKVVVVKSSIDYLGDARPPEAPVRKIKQLAAGDEMFRLVNARGVVRRLSLDPDGRLVLHLYDGKNFITASFNAGAPFAEIQRQLYGAVVLVKGVVQPQTGGKDAPRAALRSTNPSEIVIVQRCDDPFLKAVSKPFEMIPALDGLADLEAMKDPFTKILEWDPSLYRVRCRVEEVRTRLSIRVKESSRTFTIENQEGLPPVIPGDEIEAVGFPEKNNAGKFLGNARVRVVKSSDLPAGSKANYLHFLHAAQEIRQLRPEAAATAIPVRLFGTATHVGKVYTDFFVQDATGAVYVTVMPRRPPNLQPGSQVIVSGVTDKGTFSPCIINAAVTVLPPGNLPRPDAINPEDIPSGRMDAMWVELDGIVQQLIKGTNYQRLRIASRVGQVNILIANGEDLSSFMDRRVRVNGVYLSNFRKRTQTQGFEIMTPSAKHMTLLDTAPATAITPKRRDIGKLLEFDPVHEPGRQSFIAGMVTAHAGSDSFFMQDSTGGIFVQLRENEPLPPLGKVVGTQGYPESNGRSLTLREAMIRETTEVFSIVPYAYSSIDELLEPKEGKSDPEASLPPVGANRLVVVEGEFALFSSPGDQLVLELTQGDNRRFKAVLPSLPAENLQKINGIQPGSHLRLTGVCRTQGDSDLGVIGVEINLRTFEDIEVLQRPPWWTQGRILKLLYAAGVLLFLAVVTVVYFRYRLRRQSREINERLTRELHLEDRYRELVENANDLIFSLDSGGIIRDWNNAGEAIIGLSRDQLIGQPLSHFLAPGTEKDVTTLYSDKPERILLNLRTARQQAVTIEVATRPMLENGLPVGLQAIGRDVTERNRLEERTREIAKMQAVGRLAGGVAHDFNNLLTVINGNCELLIRQTPSNPLQRELLEEVKTAGTQAASVTRQLLAFGRRTVINPKPLNLNQVIQDLARVLKRAIGDSISLCFRPDAEVELVRVDPGSLEQAILNLVVNARDAMPDGGTLTVRTCNLPDGWVRLEVSDNGHGMSPEIMQRIFEPYFTTKPNGHGTGLGLAMVSGFVEQSSGRISVRSEPGAGTTFQLEFESTRQDGISGIILPASLTPSRPNDGQIILLVEDEPSVQLLEKRILESGKYNVIAAGSAEEALEIMASHTGPLDMLVTDVVMPGKNGRELAEELRRQRPDLRVLFMSGYTPDEVLREGVEADAAQFLQKPFTPSDLLRKVREILTPTVIAGDTIVSV